MELQNTAKYECRSLLSCFSGGTVYDRSVAFDGNSCGDGNSNDTIGTNICKQKQNESLVDSTTHLDDDEFNDRIECNQSSQNKQVPPPPILVDAVIDCCNCNFITQNNNNHLSSSIYTNKLPLYEPKAVEVHSQYSSLPSNNSDSNTSSDISWQENNESGTSCLSTTMSTSRVTHKRKQTYVVKDDSCFEMASKEYEALESVFYCRQERKKEQTNSNNNNNNNNKKISLHPNERLYGLMRMSSILKTRKLDHSDDGRKEIGMYNAKNKVPTEQSISESSSSNFSMVDSSSSSNNKQNVDLRENLFTIPPFNSLRISTEFTNPDYFENIQPLEKIMTDAEKLITPTIEVEMPRACSIDYNGNKIVVQNKENNNDSQSYKDIESLLLAKSILAKRLKFSNFFNTCNNSVMNEVFFDKGLPYKRIKLDLNLPSNNERKEATPQLANKSFKSVSLMETLNELQRFGGLAEENREGDAPLVIDEPGQFSKDAGLKEKLDQSESSISSGSQNDTISADDPSSEGTITSSETETQKSSTSLKIKIIRVATNKKNEYVIGDSVQRAVSGGKTKTANKVIKNVDRYECADCFEKFRTKKLLSSHVSAFHKGPYEIECDICHMKSKRSSAHKKHLPWCQMNKKFKCHLCSKEYCYNTSLNKHLKTHHNVFNTNYGLVIKEEPKDPLA